MIPVEKAALLYCTNKRDIVNWAKKHQLTISRIGNKLLVDEIGLQRIIELNTRLSRYDEYLEEQVRIREKEMTNVLIQIDDLIYLFKSVRKVSPTLRLLVEEMAELIPSEIKRNIFIAILQGGKIDTIAKQFDLSYDKVCYYYESALKYINNKAGFLKDYRKTLIDKELEIRKCQIENVNLKAQLSKYSEILDRMGYLDESEAPINHEKREIPAEIIRTLSINVLTSLNLDIRICNCLRALDLWTVEDLLRYMKDKGWERFLESRNFGKKSLKILKKKFEETGIVMSDGSSDLFEYLK